MHISPVERAGLESLGEGQKLKRTEWPSIGALLTAKASFRGRHRPSMLRAPPITRWLSPNRLPPSKGAPMTMSTKIIPFRPPAHLSLVPSMPDANYARSLCNAPVRGFRCCKR